MKITTKIRKFLAGGLVLAAVLLALVLISAVSSQAAEKPQPRAASILGLTRVDGQEVIVEIVVVVRPGENAQQAARAALRRAYPDAREIDSSEYSLTGLVWDQFSDGNAGNDFVTVSYNPKGVPGNLSGHRTVWSVSQAAWTNVVSSNFVFSDGGDTGRCPSLVRECKGPQKFDGKNDVGWLDIKDPSILGVTWFGTSTDEFDMVLDNKNFSWYIGDPAGIPANSFDTETVWLHEFGHGLGLGHSDVEGAIMEPFYEGVRRTLHQDDIDGTTFLYPGGGATPTPTPTPTPTETPTPTPTPTPQPGDSVSVSTITYLWYGGKNSNKHLDDTLAIVDNNGNPVAGATVSITLTNDAGGSWNGTGATGSGGAITFSLKNAPAGCYETTVNSVSAEGLNWDNQTPVNDSCAI